MSNYHRIITACRLKVLEYYWPITDWDLDCAKLCGICRYAVAYRQKLFTFCTVQLNLRIVLHLGWTNLRKNEFEISRSLLNCSHKAAENKVATDS